MCPGEEGLGLEGELRHERGLEAKAGGNRRFLTLGTAKPTVERHRQCEVRVRIGPTPYSRDAREGYHAGWRTRAKAVTA